MALSIQCTVNNFNETKKSLSKKHTNETKDIVENFIKFVNPNFESIPSLPNQIRKAVKNFNIECEKIKHSTNNVQNYRKSMINNMEIFVNEIIKFQNHENDNAKKMKTNKRKNRNF